MLTIVRNRTWAFDATIYDTYVGEGDPGNVPTNHTGWTIRSQIRKKIGNVLVANLNVTFPVPVSGTIAIRHERDFTRSLATGDYWWDIVATDAAGNDYVYVEPEPIAVRDNPTDPANATYSFVPGGGGVISHTHLISDVTGLQTALSGKQPIDADLTAIAALTTTANGRALLTSANALTIGASASVSGTNTGDQDLSGLVPRLSTLTVTGTTPAFPDPLVEQGSLNYGRRAWASGDGGTLLYDGASWLLTQLDPDGTIVYNASKTSGSYEPWKLTGWGLSEGSGQPSFAIDPPVLLPVNASGTIALTSRMDGQPDKLTGGTISGATAFASGATFTYSGTSASDHRIALGLGTTDAVTFGNGTFATGSISTSQPLTLTQTWTNAATTYTGMRVNVTDTASNAASLLMDLQVGGVSRLSVNKLGLIALPPRGNDGTGIVFGGTSITDASVYVGQYGLRLSQNRGIEWSSGTNLNATLDLCIWRDAANTLAQRNSTAAQTSRIYDTYASASDYHRLAIATARATATGMSGASVTLTDIIPAGAVVVGVTCKVTTAITGATSFQLGTTADPDRFGAAIAITLGATSDNQNWTSGTVECFPSATSLVLTANSSNFTGGAVYVSVQYLSGQSD